VLLETGIWEDSMLHIPQDAIGTMQDRISQHCFRKVVEILHEAQEVEGHSHFLDVDNKMQRDILRTRWDLVHPPMKDLEKQVCNLDLFF